jgi:hypothetical protein
MSILSILDRFITRAFEHFEHFERMKASFIDRATCKVSSIHVSGQVDAITAIRSEIVLLYLQEIAICLWDRLKESGGRWCLDYCSFSLGNERVLIECLIWYLLPLPANSNSVESVQRTVLFAQVLVRVLESCFWWSRPDGIAYSTVLVQALPIKVSYDHRMNDIIIWVILYYYFQVISK